MTGVVVSVRKKRTRLRHLVVFVFSTSNVQTGTRLYFQSFSFSSYKQRIHMEIFFPESHYEEWRLLGRYAVWLL
jgi:hypothetical protein